MKLYRIILGGLMVIGVMGCGDSTAFKDPNKLHVATTIGMITDVVENIGQDLVEVKGLMGPGIDPHLYRASESDVRLLNEAQLILYNGLHLESKLIEVFDHLKKNKSVVAVTNDIPVDELITDPESGQFYDPHVWFDVELWATTVGVIRDALIEQLPQHKQKLMFQAQAYLVKLRQLDMRIQKQIDELPQEQRILLTAHDAFRYFGQAYQFDVRGLQGISTQSEAGVDDVQGMVEFIIDRNVPAIFIESSVPRRYVESVQAGVSQKGQTLAIGGELFSDAMGDAGSEEGTYIGMVEHNVAVIVSALSVDKNEKE